jgi:hypothetical protein
MRKNNPKKIKLEREKGQNLVEFASAIVIVLIMLSGAIDFGRVYITLVSLNDVAQESAIYASLAPSDITGIKQRVRDTSRWPVDLSSLPDDQIEVQTIGSACAGNSVKVKLTYNFNFIAPFIFGENLNLSSEAVDTILTPPC